MDELDRVKAQNRKHRQLLDVYWRIGLERELDALLPMVMGEMSQLLDADRSSLFLVDWEGMELRARIAEGVEKTILSVPLRMGIIGSAILGKRLVNVANAYEHPYFNHQIDEVSGFRTESILAAPLITPQGEVIGGIELLNKHTGRFTHGDGERLQAAAEEFAAMHEAGKAGHDFAAGLVQELSDTCDCMRGSLFLLDEENGCLVSLYAQDLNDQEIRINFKLGIAGLVAVSGHALMIEDAARDPRFDPSFDRVTGYSTRSVLCVPLPGKSGESIGVVQVINKRSGPFTADDLATLRHFAAMVAISIENALLLEELDQQFHSILAGLAASIDAKDPLTAGHSQRVAEYATGIAQQLGFTGSELDVLGVAAILHDYGKIGIDDHVLKKNGKLTTEEYTHIQMHARLTHDILEKIRFSRKYRNVPKIASSHHECLDGSGYPHGLKSHEIPFMAKIIAVADVFEALTVNRHYRQGMPPQNALAILREGAGTKFDPNIIEALERYCLDMANTKTGV